MWRKSFDLQVNSVWNGLDAVLEKIRGEKEPIDITTFENHLDIEGLREGGKPLVALLQGVADENGYSSYQTKSKLPSYSNLFGA